jgi:hypothetical protein
MKRLWLTILLPVLLLALLWWLVKYVWAVVFAPAHAWRLAVSVDQLANTAFNGNEDETISSRAGRHCFGSEEDKEWWACILCNKLLDKIEPGHCKNNIGV